MTEEQRIWIWKQIGGLLKTISDEDWKDKYVQFHIAQKDAFMKLPASTSRHHCWNGGYAWHIYEVMLNALQIFDNLKTAGFNQFPFSEDELICASYVHDLDKLLVRYTDKADPPSSAQLKYARSLGINIEPNETKNSISPKIDCAANGKPQPSWRELGYYDYDPNYLKVDDAAIVRHLMAIHELPCTEVMLQGICLHEGGFTPILRSGHISKTNPIWAIMHSADLLSSQVQNGLIPFEGMPDKEITHL